MKSKICIVYILSFLSVVGAGVKAADNTPFIKGYLKNCNNEKVYIAYEDTKDSVQTNKDGYFYYLASNIKRASIVTLIVPGRISPNFYLAPGFKLSIKSDATSQKNFYDSLQLTGIGSVSNLYFKYFYLLQSKRTPSPLSDGWYNIKFGSFANDGLGKLQLDSFTRFVSDSIFGPKNKEPNHETFKTLSIAANNLNQLSYLFDYAWMNDLSREQKNTLLHECIDSGFLKGLLNDEYLVLGRGYKELVTFLYLDYLAESELLKSPEKQINPFEVKMKIVDSLYPAELKAYAFNFCIAKKIPDVFSLRELESVYPFILKETNSELKKGLLKSYEKRKEELSVVDVGRPAPVFNLPDADGKMFSLKDFKGKVVLIDLWASFCGPCIQELPALKKIVDEYSNSNKVQFISIACNDVKGREKRKQIAEQLNVNWLQLEDKNDFVYNNYKVTFIPRFILIDKAGNILDFDAPEPSNREALVKALNKAIGN